MIWNDTGAGQLYMEEVQEVPMRGRWLDVFYAVVESLAQTLWTWAMVLLISSYVSYLELYGVRKYLSFFTNVKYHPVSTSLLFAVVFSLGIASLNFVDLRKYAGNIGSSRKSPPALSYVMAILYLLLYSLQKVFVNPDLIVVISVFRLFITAAFVLFSIFQLRTLWKPVVTYLPSYAFCIVLGLRNPFPLLFLSLLLFNLSLVFGKPWKYILIGTWALILASGFIMLSLFNWKTANYRGWLYTSSGRKWYIHPYGTRFVYRYVPDKRRFFAYNPLWWGYTK